MTPEELLKPRYKVVARYPVSPYKVGEIISVNDLDPLQGFVSASDIGAYPKVFQLMEWWEERKFEEIPKYFKNSTSVFKVLDYSNGMVFLKDWGWAAFSALIPITEAEYLAQQGQGALND